MNIQKVENFRSFRGVCNENLIVTPLKKPGKNEPYYVVHNIKKYYRKMSLVFPENSKNSRNHGLIEVDVMGRHVYWARWNWSRLLCKLPEICNTQEIICFSFVDCSQFKFFRKLRLKKNWPSQFGDPPLTIRFRFRTYLM